MNFFEHQDQARRNTTQLIALFFLAIATMIVAFYGITFLVLRAEFKSDMGWWQPELLLLVSIITLGIIGFGSLTKMHELRGGGATVAASLGGRSVNPQTDDVKELQLLNVVAEMSLASGTPIPTVYLLPYESGINAFAAGYSPDNAVIGVTQGCLDHLNRDELQGVIAHEFSHILNGDMRLNLKLIGVLQGLLFIHILGRMLLRSDSSSRRRNSKGDGAFIAIGLSMAVIGWIGLMFGRLIKSAVSRQREFLADASAVQFTRNPDGLAGALRRSGGLVAGSTLQTPKAEEASHMFFGTALRLNLMQDWFATHPPLQERMRRLTGRTLKVRSHLQRNQSTQTGSAHGMGLAPGVNQTQRTAKASPATPPMVANQFVAKVGTVNAQQISQAQTFLQTLPTELKATVRSPEGAMALVYALLIDSQPKVRSRQLQHLQQPRLVDTQQVNQLADLLTSIDVRHHLPLLDLSIPALKTLSAKQCTAFFKQVNALVQADGRLSISEYVLQLILKKRLRAHFQKKAEPPKAVTQLNEVWHDCQVVLTILARIGHPKADDALYAFKSGLGRLPDAHKREAPTQFPQVKLHDLGKSLTRLEAAVPKLKQAIVDAAAHTVLIDNQVTHREAELLRVVVITLDCPIPPFLDAAPKIASNRRKPIG
ncbi:MAG: M48 family metallopeptidase [Leptolyngbyaceae cyanobacterium]